MVEYDARRNPPVVDELLAAMLGPTGNLRAPTLVVGKTLIVGFNEELYRRVFGQEDED